MTPNGASLGAQDAPRVGELVQASLIRPSDVNASWCTAPVTAVEGDTLVLAASVRCPRGTYTTDFRVVRGNHGSRLRNTGRGLMVGAIAGGLVGVAGALVDQIVPGECRVDPCIEEYSTVEYALMYGVVGVQVGALIGSVVGAVRPAGPRWVKGDSKRPIRIGRLDLHPGLRVSFGGHGR